MLSAVMPAAADDRRLEAQETALREQFDSVVRPFLQEHCITCHGQVAPEAKLDLESLAAERPLGGHFQVWDMVRRRLEAGEMPPAEADPQPTAAQRHAMVQWITAARLYHAERHAGDPGVVVVRRLSAAEYNYTVRDLTGVDIRPANDFPVDPANEAGFDNSGESLAMSPALVTKYLAAARKTAEHLVLKPDGIAFAPHPVVTETDRDKYAVNRIIDFYKRQPTDLAEYFLASWQFQHREVRGEPELTLEQLAHRSRLSRPYLARVWDILTDTTHAVGPIARLQAMWHALPAPQAPGAGGGAREATSEPTELRSQCEAIRDWIVALRAELQPQFPNLRVRGMNRGSQPLVMWRNLQYAAHRMRYDPGALRIEPASSDAEAEQRASERGEDDATEQPKTDAAIDERSERNNRRRQQDDPEAPSRRDGMNADLVVPADPEQRARYEEAFRIFCQVFPDAFYISERGRIFLDRNEREIEQERGRLLSAGFHSMMGYFRDDAPLYELILDDAQREELDRLWQELDFITSAPMRQHEGFIWFERTDSRFMLSSEFDFARAEDKDATSEEKIRKLAEVYLAKAERNGADDVAMMAIQDHFERINASIRWVEQAREAAEPLHLEAIQRFAARAYRRPLDPAEAQELVEFYHQLRREDGLDHDEAMRDVMVRILMSPHFCFRMDLAEVGRDQGPLTGYALANRLSYFLWSSMPDDELLEHAARGDLHERGVLLQQTRRMLTDARVRGVAIEFGTNWLDIRRFQELNTVDRKRFPQFDDALRQAMFEEPVRFLTDLLQNNRSLLDLLYARHTFVNGVLARHYGMPQPDAGTERWIRVDDADAYGRGGILPMAAFLTQNAPGLRTSPVKRGYWVVRRLLGEHIPPPPPDVPELPKDESEFGERTLREVLAKHREHPNCAACHARFDAMGLVFEGYGPIGERRREDLGGRPVDVRATFPGGMEGEGLDGLRHYLRQERQREFLDNFCRKLLSYALGRTLIPSDDPMVEQMVADLESSDFRVGGLIEDIVTSPQFLNRPRAQQVGARGETAAAAEY